MQFCYAPPVKKTAPSPASAKVQQLAAAHELSVRAAEAVISIDVTMTRIRRSMARRELARRVLSRLDTDLDMSHLDIISAISGAASEPGGGPEVTVGYVAGQMNIDPSRASRLVAEVVDRGYARRVASQQDSRRICLELTPRGAQFVEGFRDVKWNIFAGALGNWSEEELVTFAGLLDRFSYWTRHAPLEAAAAPEEQGA